MNAKVKNSTSNRQQTASMTALGSGQYLHRGAAGATLLSIGSRQTPSEGGAAELRARLRDCGISPRDISCVVVAQDGLHRGIVRGSVTGQTAPNFPAARHIVRNGAGGEWSSALPAMEVVAGDFTLPSGASLGEACEALKAPSMPAINLGALLRPRIVASEFAAVA